MHESNVRIDGFLFVGEEKEHKGLIEIICNDQNRLRGDYNDVFFNFHDVNYIAPNDKQITWRVPLIDDIPF